MSTAQVRGAPPSLVIGIVGIAGGLALALGSFLNWATVSVNLDTLAGALGIDPAQVPGGVRAGSTVSVTGWRLDDGKWTFAAGIVVLVVAVALTSSLSARVLAAVMIVGGAVGGGVALYDATIQRNQAIDELTRALTGFGLPGQVSDFFSVTLGIGVWLSIAGGGAAVAAGVMAMGAGANVPLATDASSSPATPLGGGFGPSGVGGSMAPPPPPPPAPDVRAAPGEPGADGGAGQAPTSS